jgi:arylsulfatase A
MKIAWHAASGLLLVISVLLGPVPAALAGPNQAQRPNIIFFLTDDHRHDAMGCAGNPIIKTPTMDKLAKKGVRFKNAFVTTSICAASRASLFTSMVERTHRYTFGTPPLRPEHVAVSYPVLLRQAGYRTGFIGKFGVGVEKGTQAKMFDSYVPVDRNPYFRKAKDGTIQHLLDISCDAAIEFLQDCKNDQPFCLSISFNEAHAEDGDLENHFPYPKWVEHLYADEKMPEPRLNDPKIFESQPEFLKKSMNRIRYFWRWDTPEKYQKNLRNYFRMISGVDTVMAKVLAEVDRLGFAENTIIIFSGDNGYYMANRGFAGKWSHYEDSLRVPLIIYDPRLPMEQRGKLVEEMALNIDIPRTMLDLAGIKGSKLLQGRSLVPLIEGQHPGDWRTDFFCEHLMEHKDIPKWEGVRDQRWVYARYFDQKPVFEFLHDLKADPDQLKNLATDPQYAKQLEVMSKRCNELRDQYGGPFQPHPKKGQPVPKKKTAQEKRPPNLIIILCDNLGYGDIGCFGSKKHRTPHIDEMAAEGMRFTSFYATSGVCTPSRASLMTGCYPRRVNMHLDDKGGAVLRPVSPKGLHPDEVTIAELLQRQGYATALIGKWHLGDQPSFLPTRQGFDYYLGIPYSDDMTAREGQPWPPLPLMQNEKVIEAPVDRQLLTKRYTEATIDFLTRNKERPFFIVLSHAMPGSTTTPYSSEKFRGKSGNGSWGDAVEEIDWSTGEIFAALKKLNLDNNTLVVWTSDNGAPKRNPPQGLNLPLSGWGYEVSEGGMRVPCIVRWPGRVAANEKCDEPCTTMDLLPTFVWLAGGSLPHDRIIDGKSIWPLMVGMAGRASPHEAIYFYDGEQLQAIRSGKWKLYLPLESKIVRGKEVGKKVAGKLYDLNADILESRNLFSEQPKIVERLTVLAEAARNDLGDGKQTGKNQRPAGWQENPTPRIMAGN